MTGDIAEGVVPGIDDVAGIGDPFTEAGGSKKRKKGRRPPAGR
jgi:hypothetical protein